MHRRLELNKIPGVKQLRQRMREAKNALENSASQDNPESRPLTLDELITALRELALQGLAYQYYLFYIWGLLFLSVPLDFVLLPLFRELFGSWEIDGATLALILLAVGAGSLVLSYHRSLLFYGQQLDRGLNTFQKSVGDHPWLILGIFLVAILFELSIRLESLGVWPLLGIFVLVIAVFPIFAGNWRTQLKELSSEHTRRVRILRGAQNRNFIVILIGMILARGFSLVGMVLIATGESSALMLVLFSLGSLVLLAAALPYQQMFVDRCRRCGRTVPIPLEEHHLCLICTKRKKLLKTEGHVVVKPVNRS